MNAIYEKNRAAFAKRYAAMASFVDGLDTANYRVQKSSSGHPILEFLKSPGVWEACDHPENPVTEAATCVGNFKGEKNLILVLGMGLGHLFFETVKRYPESRILVVEHDGKIFKKALETFDFSPYFSNPNFGFIVAARADHLTHFFNQYFHDNDNDLYLPALELVKNDRILKFSGNYYLAASKIFTQAVKYYWEIYVGNNCHDAMKGLRYVLTNLKSLSKMMVLEPYLDHFHGRPGIVVSSGPSLSNKFEALRAVQDKAVIICADSALKKLLENGIVPFGVACVERDDINAELFQGYAIPGQVILFAPPLIKPVTVDTYPGPVCTFFRNSYPFKGLPDFLPHWHYGLSCSHLAYQALNYLGCGEIALVGQDLAYDRDSGTSHFAGAIDFALAQYEGQERIPVVDNQGGQIGSSKDWVTFRDFYEEMIAANASRHRVLNVIEPEHGARIVGTELTAPAVYFERIRSLPQLPDFDPAAGRGWVAEKSPGFTAELAQFKVLAVCALDGVITELADLAHAKTYSEYLARKKALVARLDAKTLFLFSDLTKPILKPFEANAATIWTNEEFTRHVAGAMQNVTGVVTELREVLSL